MLELANASAGRKILIDAPIFIYHFVGRSRSCRYLLERCERGEVPGVTTVLTLAEVAHRLMMIEAVDRRLATPGQVAKKLRRRPEIVRQLRAYRTCVEGITRMGIKIMAIELSTFLRAAELRERHGLLTNDSLFLASALEHEIDAIASADRDFAAVDDVELFQVAGG